MVSARRGRTRLADGSSRYANKEQTRSGWVSTAARFRPQQADGDCVPTCLKNVTDEFFSRINNPRPLGKIPLRKFYGACGYSMRSPVTQLSPDQIRKELDPLLQPHRLQSAFVRGTDVEMRQLREVADRHQASYPVVTVAPAYFDDPDLGYRVRSPSAWHHTLVVFQVSDEAVTFYDPWAKYMNPDLSGNDLVKILPLVRFRRYWEESAEYKDAFWLRPKEGTLA